MPTVLRALGFSVRIYPNDHAPPHVHVVGADGVTDRLMSMEDVASMIDGAAPKPGERGPYKKMAS